MKIKHQNKEYLFPDFIIAGAAKSGTTSFHKYLCFHPRIFMPKRKELWFLHLLSNPNKEILTRHPNLPVTIDEYSKHFENSNLNQILGEATPSYLMFPDFTIGNIKKFNPDYRKTKIVIILREPINKIISLYRFNLKIRTEYYNINRALLEEQSRRDTNKKSIGFNYVYSSLYFNQVKLFKENFDDVLVFTFEEFKEDLKNVLIKTANFLNIDPAPILENPMLGEKYNLSNFVKPDGKLNIISIDLFKNYFKYLPKSLFRPDFLAKQLAFFKFLKTTKEDIDQSKYQELKRIFKEDVEKLQTLLDRDFSRWLSKY